MENLYSRLIDLLGKPRCSPEYTSFLDTFDENPERIADGELMSVDVFKNAGVFIHVFSNQIEEISFCLSAITVNGEARSCYRGELPCGVERTDDRASVIQKLGMMPRSKRVVGPLESEPEDYWDAFDLQPWHLVFVFEGKTTRIRDLFVSLDDFEARWAKTLRSTSVS